LAAADHDGGIFIGPTFQRLITSWDGRSQSGQQGSPDPAREPEQPMPPPNVTAFVGKQHRLLVGAQAVQHSGGDEDAAMPSRQCHGLGDGMVDDRYVSGAMLSSQPNQGHDTPEFAAESP